MNTFQKIIKALAIALAVFIIFIVASVIFSIITTISKITFLADIITIDESEVISFSETYDIEQVTSLDVESSIAKLEIYEADKIAVEATDVTKKFSATVENGKLLIKEKATTNISINGQVNPTIKVYIPEGFVFESVDIESGVGDTYIESLEANIVEISTGVGNLEAEYIDAKTKIDIEAGVGRLNIRNSILNNLSFEAGVGEYNITTYLTGNSKLECGVGNGTLTLNDFSQDMSKIRVQKGIGDININGQNYSNNQTYGNGTNIIDVEGGVGNVSITLN